MPTYICSIINVLENHRGKLLPISVAYLIFKLALRLRHPFEVGFSNESFKALL
jgi:hypothetical protein